MYEHLTLELSRRKYLTILKTILCRISALNLKEKMFLRLHEPAFTEIYIRTQSKNITKNCV